MIPDPKGGVLPVLTGDPTDDVAPRAPYEATMLEIVNRFGGSRRRRAILRGFIRMREQLRQLGVTDGFQWISGSFVEEGLDREPGDVDVVTFTLVGGNTVLDEAMGPLLTPSSKGMFDVDSYLVDLAWERDVVVWWAVYWYELWTSRRSIGRKGFVRIELSEDLAPALQRLHELDRE